MIPQVGVVNLGVINYLKCLKIQKRVAESVKSQKGPNGGILLLLEHPPVYTVGIRDKQYTLEEEKKLRLLGADFYKINRGGLITFHGPGQLVIYPIINLKFWKSSVRWYVENLESTTVDLCNKLSVNANRLKPYPGIWVGNNKICAIGVHISRYITTHGIALNCNVDLKWFEHIVPCGIEGKGVTSLSKETGTNITVQDALPIFVDSFVKHFPCQITLLDPHEYNY